MRVLFLESHPMWRYGLPNGFRDAGHEVQVSGPLTADNIPRIIGSFAPQLIVMLGWTEEHISLKRKWIREHVRAAGVPFVYWATEDPIHTEIFSIPFITQVQPHFVFTVSLSLVDRYEKLGFPAAHMDFGWHASVHKPAGKEQPFTCSMAVVANAYPAVFRVYPGFYRLESLQTLITPVLQAGLRVDFWGWHWDEMECYLGFKLPPQWLHGYLPYPEAYKVYNSADIVIGLQNVPGQVTQRTYEILASGGFLLTSDTPAVRGLFEPGRHLAVTNSAAETAALVRHYLARPELRREISLRGKEAVAGHSYRHRAEYIIKVLQERKILSPI
ncbi:MAG TPA: glycosyltransferase [Methylomusa anaerophila]|uniref:Spore protein YkvP n=1 Tax=Methylomusa anaerophila TaxID=1930071 RepID=A0A348AH76_9FIRM|nr:glycosyltransferase [Methylomusa anaerophila]BBB90424.1 spore protein YkvP [Methylomusa anaerophila]HML90361.1 glycosyltransferase [Methylomusa anaerophila]